MNKIITPKQNTPCEGCFIQRIASNTILSRYKSTIPKYEGIISTKVL